METLQVTVFDIPFHIVSSYIKFTAKTPTTTRNQVRRNVFSSFVGAVNSLSWGFCFFEIAELDGRLWSTGNV